MSQPVSEDEFASILKRVRRFVDEELIPLEPALLGQGFKAILPQLKEKRQMVREMGLWTPQIPVKFGGLGLTVAQFGRVSEQLARTPIGHYCFNCQAPDAGNMEILMEFGTPAQHEQFLKPLLAGDVRSCFGMTEPEHAGSNPVYMSTTAVRDGDDYVINGHKWFTSGADGAAFAIVMAVTDPDTDNRYGKMSQILVPLDTPGYELVRNVPIMGEAGDDWLTHGEVRFTDVRVPQSNVLGGEGHGFAIAQERLGPGRIHHCMRWIGISERALAMMCERAASRELSPGQPLATRQVIQHWIAESRAGIHASRLMVLDAAAKIDSVGAREARQEISMIKFFVAEHMLKILDRAIQVHGALGMTEDTPLSFWYRHERASRIYDGADEVHKTVVARYELQPHGIKVRL